MTIVTDSTHRGILLVFISLVRDVSSQVVVLCFITYVNKGHLNLLFKTVIGKSLLLVLERSSAVPSFINH